MTGPYLVSNYNNDGDDNHWNKPLSVRLINEHQPGCHSTHSSWYQDDGGETETTNHVFVRSSLPQSIESSPEMMRIVHKLWNYQWLFTPVHASEGGFLNFCWNQHHWINLVLLLVVSLPDLLLTTCSLHISWLQQLTVPNLLPLLLHPPLVLLLQLHCILLYHHCHHCSG